MESEISEGQRKIEEKVKEIASHEGKEITDMVWESGQNDTFTLLVKTGSNKNTLRSIPREQIEDYPGKVGIAVLESNLKGLVASL